MNFEDRAIGIMTVFVVLFAIAFIPYEIAQAIVQGSTHRACLEKGWPDDQVTWNFEKFCVKRIDQTDHVEKLSNLK